MQGHMKQKIREMMVVESVCLKMYIKLFSLFSL